MTKTEIERIRQAEKAMEDRIVAHEKRSAAAKKAWITRRDPSHKTKRDLTGKAI